MSVPVAVPLSAQSLPLTAAPALPLWLGAASEKPSATPLTVPSPTECTRGGLPLLTTAPSPAVGSPMPMLMLLPAAVQVTCPLMFWFCPSTVSTGPAAAAAAEDGPEDPVLDLLLEHPALAATSRATPATPTTIPRFTTASLRVAGSAASSRWPRQHR